MRKDIHAQYFLQTEKCSVLRLTQIKFSISFFKKKILTNFKPLNKYKLLSYCFKTEN